MRKTTAWLAALGLTLGAAACTDTLEKGYEIHKTRVLGASLSVGGDPTVASAGAGEMLDVSWIVAEPGNPRPLSWAFVGCVPASARNGEIGCVGGPFGITMGTARPPMHTLVMPDAATLGGATSVTVFGAICAGGTLDFSGGGPMMPARCTGDRPDEINVTLSVALTTASGPNHNPTLAEDSVSLAGSLWAPHPDAASVPLDGCAALPDDPTLRHLPAGAPAQEVQVLFDDADRETFTYTHGTPAVEVTTRETLQLSEFVSLGKLGQQFFVVEATDPTTMPKAAFDYTPPTGPAEVSAGGTLVRMWVVLRDLRGGVASGMRLLCVTR